MGDQAQQSATITVGTISIPVEIREVPVGDVRYYKSNPRIFSILKQRGANVSQDVIEQELWNLDSTKDLYRDIQRNGGLLEEVLVRDEEVLEGNSRLCAYRRLLSYAKESGDQTAIAKWSNIRAKILPSGVNEETVFAILGILHVRGKAEWRPYERGSYLYRQSVEFRKNSTELAEQIGCSETEVRNSIEAFKMMDEAEVRDPEKFSYFVEYKKSRKMTDAEQLLRPDEDLDKLFVGWVKDGVIPRAERVRDIPIIFNDKKARRAFLEGRLSFDNAVELAKERHPETESSFYNKLKRATAALEAAEPQRVQEEVEADSGKKHILDQLCKTIIRFCDAVGIQVSAINRIQKRGKPRP
jgi:hypothetical protein